MPGADPPLRLAASPPRARGAVHSGQVLVVSTDWSHKAAPGQAAALRALLFGSATRRGSAA